ncbi:RbsD/FucU family protein [Oricola indica]|uniref:RbsD/FucU family protein n=1 Tax=Oricola indica TaxID=2872591 RepID=UPI003CCBD354
MLKTIDPRMTPDLMDCLMRMGHGDEIVIVDANYPAESTAVHTVNGAVVRLPAIDAPEAIRLITGLMPLDGFADYCALRMEIDNSPDELGDVHRAALAVIDSEKPEGAAVKGIERQGFYQHARKAYAVVATTEARPFGCFVLRKGVIF